MSKRKIIYWAFGVIAFFSFSTNVYSEDFIAERIFRIEKQLQNLTGEQKIDSVIVLVDLCSYDLPHIGIEIGERELQNIENYGAFRYKKGYLLNGLGKIYNQLDEYQRALYYYEKAHKVMIENSDDYGLAIVKYNLAYNLISLVEFALASDYLFKSLELAKKTGNSKIEADANSTIGILYYILGNNEDAISRSMIGLEISSKNEYKEGKALAHEHLGIIYTPLKIFDKAEYHLKEALKLQEKIGDKFGIAEAAESYSLLKIYLNKSFEALELLEQSIAITERLNVTKSMASAYSNMGTTYQNLGEYDTALRYFNNSVAILKTIKDYRALYYVYRRMSFTYEAMGNYKKALESSRFYKEYSDSVYNAVKTEAISGAKAKIESAQKIYKFKQLEIENKLNKRTQLFLVISLGFALLAVFGFIFAFNQKRKANLQLGIINNELNEKQVELKKLNTELTVAIEDKDKFIKILAHDLKSPFFGILGISSLLSDTFDNISSTDMKNYLLTLNGALRNLFELLENLLSWSRLSSDKIKFNPENVSLCSIINSTINLFKFNLEEKSLTIENANAQHCNAFVDKNMFEAVIRNLLSNAIKFSKPNGKIEISVMKNNEEVEFTIKDYGVGISPENLSKILKNKPISTIGTNNERGTGLGLELCKEFISANNGKFSIESELNYGTTIKFSLPIERG